MSNLLDILQETADPNPTKIAKILGLPVEEVESEIKLLREEGSLLGWVPLLHPSHKGRESVRAVIEVKISPEREGGFDRMAQRISKFEEVEACHLMSGAYDLMVIVRERICMQLHLLYQNAFPQLRAYFQQRLIFYSVLIRSTVIC